MRRIGWAALAAIIITVAVLLLTAGSEVEDSTITVKEYRLTRPVQPPLSPMMDVVSRALDRPISNFIKGLTGGDRSRDYTMWAYRDFGKLILVATERQHRRAAGALQRAYGDLLQTNKRYDSSAVESTETFARHCSTIVREAFDRLNFTFLTTEDVHFIAQDIADFVRTYTRSDVPKEMQLKILEALDEYIVMTFPTTSMSLQERVYLRFDDKLKTLKLKLWQIIATAPPTEEEQQTLAAQKQWIYDYAENNFPTTEALEKARRMYRADTVFQDVLNGFSLQPMPDEIFQEMQNDVHNQDDVAGVANAASCWSTEIARARRRLHRKTRGQWAFPFGVVSGYSGGSDRVDFSFESDKPFLHSTVRLSDAPTEDDQYCSYDIAGRRGLKAPADCNSTSQRLAWINEQDRGHLYFDEDSQSLVPCRGAMMATLDVHDWIASDRISTSDLRQRIRAQALPRFCISGYRNLGDDSRDDKLKPVIPIIAIETKEGAIAVLRPMRLKRRRPGELEFRCRHRPDNWRRQWFSTFITGDTNETIGQRHMQTIKLNPIKADAHQGL
jgi:hypothetical protein